MDIQAPTMNYLQGEDSTMEFTQFGHSPRHDQYLNKNDIRWSLTWLTCDFLSKKTCPELVEAICSYALYPGCVVLPQSPVITNTT